MLTVVSERDAKKPIGLPASLVKLANESKFQHVVVDIATDLPNIGSILVEIEPDLVLLGVRRYDIGSFVHLNDMLIAIRTAMPLITSSVDIKILPIGVEKSEFQEYFNPSILPCHILEPLDWMPREAGRAIFVDYTYLWSRDGCEGFWDYYRSILEQYKK
ncbi:hypothetical protein NEA10_04915 [Phormidium yuhuli AB48]|uniref:Uncharacterized protein n=1 Tax=Phormidium yuhuli AB48 TaxID=2940671 RepID=A0ABY5AS67_9CYAN|nr:hypothetical protein [Phormidium yuhuli]USR92067.1 hypothetical protein NEA10_04915 [Phormidium yuhuli AB48]